MRGLPKSRYAGKCGAGSVSASDLESKVSGSELAGARSVLGARESQFAGATGEVCAMAGKLHKDVSRIFCQPNWRWRNQFHSSTHSSSTFAQCFQ